ncbi:DUF1549 domain-containing protein [Biomphalaria pfeifferi]|uniref:DUF1549 domain-containing protein n=1 Tax=Biomphalaria pfeifferi TaxID=112525 RepID=A0AAD8ESU9_BIOPF|nr:DUF1549 domain-containing protein [Biomphalaria pfeifferi]
MISSSTDVQDRIHAGLRLSLIRPITDNDAQPLLNLLNDAIKAYEADPKQAEQLIASARGTCPPNMPPHEYAAWIIASSTILNLDEFLSRN